MWHTGQKKESPVSARPTLLQIIPELETGGAEQTTVDVAAAAAGAGWHSLVASQGGRMVRLVEEAGGHHIALPLKSKNPLTMWSNAGRIAKLVGEHDVDILHARSRAPAWSALMAARRTGRPLVTTYHGAYKQAGALKGAYNSVMARGDAVIANSAYIGRLIAARHPFAADRITVIHRGTDLARFRRDAVSPARMAALRRDWGIADGARIVLQVARLTGWKGQAVLVDAMARISHKSDIVAVLAGDAQGRDAYVDGLKRQIAGHGLQDRVHLVGHCDAVPAALAVASVCVVCSTEPEAFGRAAVEAQAIGVPVIVSDLGAVPETVLAPPEVDAAECTGFRVPAGDADALAAAIETVLDMAPDDVDALARRAGAHVRARFSVSAMTAATLAVYDRLLAAAKGE